MPMDEASHCDNVKHQNQEILGKSRELSAEHASSNCLATIFTVSGVIHQYFDAQQLILFDSEPGLPYFQGLSSQNLQRLYLDPY